MVAPALAAHRALRLQAEARTRTGQAAAARRTGALRTATWLYPPYALDLANPTRFHGAMLKPGSVLLSGGLHVTITAEGAFRGPTRDRPFCTEDTQPCDFIPVVAGVGGDVYYRVHTVDQGGRYLEGWVRAADVSLDLPPAVAASPAPPVSRAPLSPPPGAAAAAAVARRIFAASKQRVDRPVPQSSTAAPPPPPPPPPAQPMPTPTTQTQTQTPQTSPSPIETCGKAQCLAWLASDPSKWGYLANGTTVYVPSPPARAVDSSGAAVVVGLVDDGVTQAWLWVRETDLIPAGGQ